MRVLALILATHVLAASCGGSSPTAPNWPVGDRIVVLGDSLAVSPSLPEAFPAHLQRFVEREGLPWTVSNGGVSGDTTADGAARVHSVLAGDVGVLVLALGANDGLRGIPVAEVEHHLSRIIDAARARGTRVVLCGMEAPPTHGWEYAVAFHRLFRALAARYDLPLVPFLLSGVALVPEMNLADGFHPNAAGARRVAENIWPHLEPVLRGSR